MKESPLREKYARIIKDYEQIEDAVTQHFIAEGYITKEDNAWWMLEADPSCLECLTDNGDVFHVEYEELEKTITK